MCCARSRGGRERGRGIGVAGFLLRRQYGYGGKGGGGGGRGDRVLDVLLRGEAVGDDRGSPEFWGEDGKRYWRSEMMV